MLKRFRTAFDYLDAVIHGVEPAELEHDRPDATERATASAPPPPLAPEPTEPAAEPQAEPRAW